VLTAYKIPASYQESLLTNSGALEICVREAQKSDIRVRRNSLVTHRSSQALDNESPFLFWGSAGQYPAAPFPSERAPSGSVYARAVRPNIAPWCLQSSVDTSERAFTYSQGGKRARQGFTVCSTSEIGDTGAAKEPQGGEGYTAETLKPLISLRH